MHIDNAKSVQNLFRVSLFTQADRRWMISGIVRRIDRSIYIGIHESRNMMVASNILPSVYLHLEDLELLANGVNETKLWWIRMTFKPVVYASTSSEWKCVRKHWTLIWKRIWNSIFHFDYPIINSLIRHSLTLWFHYPSEWSHLNLALNVVLDTATIVQYFRYINNSTEP